MYSLVKYHLKPTGHRNHLYALLAKLIISIVQEVSQITQESGAYLNIKGYCSQIAYFCDIANKTCFET